MMHDSLWTIPIYYEDTDAGGVVYYANYLRYFERARAEWLKNFQISQKHLASTENAIFVVKSVDIQYHTPAFLEDTLTIYSHLNKVGRASLYFSQSAKRGEVLISEAKTHIVCVDTLSLRPRSFPLAVQKIVNPFK